MLWFCDCASILIFWCLYFYFCFWIGRWWKKYLSMCQGQARLCRLWFRYLLILLQPMVGCSGCLFYFLCLDNWYGHVKRVVSAFLNLIWNFTACFFNKLDLTEALQFTSRLKAVLSRVLPILGSVRDVHRPIFANGTALTLSRQRMRYWFLSLFFLFFLGWGCLLYTSDAADE